MTVFDWIFVVASSVQIALIVVYVRRDMRAIDQLVRSAWGEGFEAGRNHERGHHYRERTEAN